MTERLHFHFSLSCIGGGNGNTLQCSCLENPMNGGAWWAAVYGVAQSRTRLKRLSSRIMSFPGGSVVKKLSAKQETRVQSLGREDLLEKEMETHSSILAWEKRSLGGLQSMESQRARCDLVTKQQLGLYKNCNNAEFMCTLHPVCPVGDILYVWYICHSE